MCSGERTSLPGHGLVEAPTVNLSRRLAAPSPAWGDDEARLAELAIARRAFAELAPCYDPVGTALEAR